jgi:hypothetical protein
MNGADKNSGSKKSKSMELNFFTKFQELKIANFFRMLVKLIKNTLL